MRRAGTPTWRRREALCAAALLCASSSNAQAFGGCEGVDARCLGRGGAGLASLGGAGHAPFNPAHLARVFGWEAQLSGGLEAQAPLGAPGLAGALSASFGTGDFGAGGSLQLRPGLLEQGDRTAGLAFGLGWAPLPSLALGAGVEFDRFAASGIGARGRIALSLAPAEGLRWAIGVATPSSRSSAPESGPQARTGIAAFLGPLRVLADVGLGVENTGPTRTLTPGLWAAGEYDLGQTLTLRVGGGARRHAAGWRGRLGVGIGWDAGPLGGDLGYGLSSGAAPGAAWVHALLVSAWLETPPGVARRGADASSTAEGGAGPR